MTNVGSIDRILRILIGLALVSTLYFYGQTTMMWIAAAVGVVLIATAFMGFCPIYRVLGIHTDSAAH